MVTLQQKIKQIMNLQYWAGYITEKMIDNRGDTAAWVAAWRERAAKADGEGKELVVFQVPKNELLRIVMWVEQELQKNFSPAPPVVDKMPLDEMFVRAILGAK